MKLFKKKKQYKNFDVDTILIDSHTKFDFDHSQMEGKIEETISKKSLLYVGVFTVVFFLILLSKSAYLQVVKGSDYQKRALRNSFDSIPLFARRGIIEDRNGEVLASNELNEELEKDQNILEKIPNRVYTNRVGLGHILGYVSLPKKDAKGVYWQTDFIGKDGVEKLYNDNLSGVNGAKLVEVDVMNTVQSSNIIEMPINGEKLTLTIDARAQEELYKSIVDLSSSMGYRGGAGVIMNIDSGDVLAMTSYPEYSPNILTSGDNQAEINNYFKDSRSVFLNRVFQGSYTPGSILKPFIAMRALKEGVVNESTSIFSSGELVYPNPFNPSKPTIFKDWRAHGYTNVREAIAVSSDVYFYQVGGGFGTQKGIGIKAIDEVNKNFGIGLSTGINLSGEAVGVIPTPEWKEKYFKDDPWRIGDTYNSAIGQYGWQVTPLQMVRAVGGIASYGQLVTPRVSYNESIKKDLVGETFSPREYKAAKEGMRMTVTVGTATVLNDLPIKMAVKTGTAQVGPNKNRINSWLVGFFPYENPKYSFAIMMESAPSSAPQSASFAMRDFIIRINQKYPELIEYLNK
jgi:penicillin-binding protein 2